MNSFSVRAEKVGLTTSTLGTTPTGAMGSKSFTGSKPVFLYSAGLMACALLIVSSSV